MGQEPGRVARAQQRVARLEALARLDGLCSVLCEPARLAILGALEQEPLTVGDLAAAIGRKVPATSQHLRILRNLGLVEGERQRTAVYYRLASGPLSDQLRAMIAALEAVLSALE
jgi:DNA-binding transcriptional ArsR family regulator